MSVFRVSAVLFVAIPVALAIACGSADAYVFDESEELPPYQDVEAVDHVGESATVCGTVHGVTQRAGQSTYLSFVRSYPNQAFAVIVEDRDASKFPSDLSGAYNKKVICASGLIEGTGGAAQITVHVPTQIVVQP